MFEVGDRVKLIHITSDTRVGCYYDILDYSVSGYLRGFNISNKFVYNTYDVILIDNSSGYLMEYNNKLKDHVISKYLKVEHISLAERISLCLK